MKATKMVVITSTDIGRLLMVYVEELLVMIGLVIVLLLLQHHCH